MSWTKSNGIVQETLLEVSISMVYTRAQRSKRRLNIPYIEPWNSSASHSRAFFLLVTMLHNQKTLTWEHKTPQVRLARGPSSSSRPVAKDGVHSPSGAKPDFPAELGPIAGAFSPSPIPIGVSLSGLRELDHSIRILGAAQKIRLSSASTKN